MAARTTKNNGDDKIITPITPDPSRVRMEIDEFVADDAMTNLFLLALEAMQTEDDERSGDNEDWWTFYSLSGEIMFSLVNLLLALTRLSRHSWPTHGELERYRKW